jgi:hypothetical protein
MRPTFIKSAILGMLLLLPLAAPRSAIAAEERFQSFNFQNRVIRHRNSLLYIEPAIDTLSANDSAFKVVRGLAGSCNSFESRNYPGFYIRHQNYRLKISKFENQDLFRKDATFCIRPGLAAPNGVSFESVNFPGHFMRHSDFELRIQQNDGGPYFKKDATYYRLPAGGPIDDL